MRSDIRGSELKSPLWLPGPAGRWFLAAALCGTVGGASAAGCGPRKSRGPEGEPALQTAASSAEIFAFGRQLGAIAPCGCTTDPLGGLDFALGQLSDSKALVLAPGSMFFPDPDDPEAPSDEASWKQAELRAELLGKSFAALGERMVTGFGPNDLRRGWESFEAYRAGPRVLSNAATPSDKLLPALELKLSAGAKLRVAVLVDPASSEQAGLPAELFPSLADPLEAAKKFQNAAETKAASLSAIVVHGPRALAETIASEVGGVDIVVAAGKAQGPEESREGRAATLAGGTLLLHPGDKGQTLSRVALEWSGDAPPDASAWTLMPTEAQLAGDRDLLKEKIQRFKGQPDADPSFIANLENQLLALDAKPAPLLAGQARVRVEQVPISCRLPSHKATKEALLGYDQAVAKLNAAHFAEKKAPEPAPGEAGYAGIETCELCHEEAAEFWGTTVHARAWATLVDRKKDLDLSCVGCHLTGFRQPGGSEVVLHEGLQDVQCEQCHGPGSLHADDPDQHKMRREAPQTVCASCHTPEHSDTFEYKAYLRDILGPGHGAEARAALGEGPTGAQLRAAGLAKAGGGCKDK